MVDDGDEPDMEGMEGMEGEEMYSSCMHFHGEEGIKVLTYMVLAHAKCDFEDQTHSEAIYCLLRISNYLKIP